MKKYLLIFGLTLIIFTTTSSFYYNNICCMFSASRYYGWPYPYFSLQKTVETLEEASQVNTLAAAELAQRGWQLHLTGDMLNSTPFGTAGNIFFNLIFAFIVASLIVWLGQKVVLKKKLIITKN